MLFQLLLLPFINPCHLILTGCAGSLHPIPCKMNYSRVQAFTEGSRNLNRDLKLLCQRSAERVSPVLAKSLPCSREEFAQIVERIPIFCNKSTMPNH